MNRYKCTYVCINRIYIERVYIHILYTYALTITIDEKEKQNWRKSIIKEEHIQQKQQHDKTCIIRINREKLKRRREEWIRVTKETSR